LTELFRKNEYSIKESIKDYSNLEIDKIYRLFTKLYEDGVAQGLFETEYSVNEYLKVLATTIIGATVNVLLLPKTSRNANSLPNVNLILSTCVKKEKLNCEKINA
jgi:hypothetical protein